MGRLDDLKLFYSLMDKLEFQVSGKRKLADCDGRMEWPNRGVYFFFESGENRSNSGTGPRVVRVGTHAITKKSRTSLWSRLSQHRGVQRTGGGNHRGSIFRLIVGTSIKRRDGQDQPTSWGVAGDPSDAARRLGIVRTELLDGEQSLEQTVSHHIGNMPFLWLDVADLPDPNSLRRKIERNSIALLSNYDRHRMDPPSSSWLGNHSDRARVHQSGLWNCNHVEETHDPGFLFDLEQRIND